MEGGIFVRGSVDSLAPAAMPGILKVRLYAVEPWSWRECYSGTCS